MTKYTAIIDIFDWKTVLGFYANEELVTNAQINNTILQWCKDNGFNDVKVFRNAVYKRTIIFENKEDFLLFILKAPGKVEVK